MFEEAGKLYDKMAGFVDTFNRIGKQIDSTAASFNKAKSQLTDGRDNVLGRIEHLKRLGAKTVKRNLKMYQHAE
ncbi:DNA recombination protein RmuC [Hydrogenimonas sp.]